MNVNLSVLLFSVDQTQLSGNAVCQLAMENNNKITHMATP